MDANEYPHTGLIARLRNEQTRKEALRSLQKLPVAEQGEVLRKMKNNEVTEILPLLKDDKQGLIISEFGIPRLLNLFQHVSKKWFAGVFEKMPSDSRADTFQLLNTQEQVALLPHLHKTIREDVLKLSAFPHDTAGGIMNTDFATLHEHHTCGESLDRLREASQRDKMLYHLYVVDKEMKLMGYLTLKDLVIADPNERVTAVMHTEFVHAALDEDRESVAVKIEKHDLVALPVLNQNQQLMGIVHHDDAIEVIRTEQTEDMEKFMGIIPGSEILNYNQTTVAGHFRKRIIWLAILTVIGLVSGLIIQRYEQALSALMVLALFIPMVADTGGNSGSQAATVVIRAMALGQVNVRNWLNILFKEARISLMLAGVLGCIAFFLILILSWESEIALEHGLGFIALGISLALGLQVITSNIIGAALPLLVKRFGGDPAVAASPAITTAVDITGLLIYFGVATLLFF